MGKGIILYLSESTMCAYSPGGRCRRNTVVGKRPNWQTFTSRVGLMACLRELVFLMAVRAPR